MARQLRQAKGHELRPAAHDAQPLTSLVLAGLGFEFMSRKEPEKLHEDRVMMSQAWISCLLNDLRHRSFYQRHGRFKPTFI